MHNYETSNQDIRVAVVGGSGYAGLELVHLLLKHPRALLRAGFTTQSSFTFADYLPRRASREVTVVDIKELEKWLPELDTVFLATPAEVSLDLAPKLLNAGVNVIDLSGAFRLKTGADYPEWYGFTHPRPDLLAIAEYGLVPWAPVSSKTAPRLIANPGCYATAVLMGLLPLLKRGLLDPHTLVIDAKSGSSGAGRKPSESLLFTEVEGECLPYRVGRHQHLPEISHFARQFSGVGLSPIFTTHLLNIRRGIIAGIYGRLTSAVTDGDLAAAFAVDYSSYGLVEWGSLSELSPRAAAFRLSLKRMVGTGMTAVYYQIVDDKLYLFSLIDNLLKGAAGQAIENFNRLQGLPSELGLKQLEGVL